MKYHAANNDRSARMHPGDQHFMNTPRIKRQRWMRRLMIDLSGPRHRLQWLCRVGGLRISLFVCAFLANLTCPHGSLEAEPDGEKRSRTWRCSGVCTSLDTAQGLILIFSFSLSCLQEDIWTHPRRAHLKHSPPALSPSCVCAWNLYTHAYASAAFVQAHDIQQQTVCAQRQISTPPLPTQHTDMKADGLDNGNSAVHFAVVNQADAGERCTRVVCVHAHSQTKKMFRHGVLALSPYRGNIIPPSLKMYFIHGPLLPLPKSSTFLPLCAVLRPRDELSVQGRTT
jgi:hypothetical protein